MVIKEYFVVEVCYVQSDVPYLHFCALSKLQRHLCDKVCLTVFTNTYTTVYYIKYSSGNQHLQQEI